MPAATIRAQRPVRQGCRHVSGGLAVEQTETVGVSVSWRGHGRVGYSGRDGKGERPTGAGRQPPGSTAARPAPLGRSRAATPPPVVATAGGRVVSGAVAR